MIHSQNCKIFAAVLTSFLKLSRQKLFRFGNLTADHRFGNAGRRRECGRQMIKPAHRQIGKSLRFQRIDVKTFFGCRRDADIRQALSQKAHQSRIFGSAAADNQFSGNFRQIEQQRIGYGFGNECGCGCGTVFQTQTFEMFELFVENRSVGSLGRILRKNLCLIIEATICSLTLPVIANLPL